MGEIFKYLDDCLNVLLSSVDNGTFWHNEDIQKVFLLCECADESEAAPSCDKTCHNRSTQT